MAMNLNSIKANVTPIKNRVLVRDMHFGEQKTKSGLIIGDDNGKTRGIYPRWAKVYAKGPDNNDEYEVNHWILVEHGTFDIRMIEAESVLAYSEEKPQDVYIGQED